MLRPSHSTRMRPLSNRYAALSLMTMVVRGIHSGRPTLQHQHDDTKQACLKVYNSNTVVP